jgi:hypothetical protein
MREMLQSLQLQVVRSVRSGSSRHKAAAREIIRNLSRFSNSSPVRP